jgi:hypothetical protein
MILFGLSLIDFQRFFIPVKTTYKGAKLVELYIARIVCLHGVPKKIVCDRGTQFASRFWKNYVKDWIQG